MHYDIYKAGAVIIENRKLLLTRTKGKDFFVAPGGKLEEGETSEEALVRELEEELTIKVKRDDLEVFDTFYAPMINDKSKITRMDVFIVNKYEGSISASNEIEEILWTTSERVKGLSAISIFDEYVIPKLKGMGLID